MTDDPNRPGAEGAEYHDVIKGEVVHRTHARSPRERVPSAPPETTPAAPTTARATPVEAGASSAKGSGGRRLRVLVASVVLVLAVALGVGYAAKVWPFTRSDEQIVEVTAGGTTYTVRAKVIGGALRVVPLDEASVKPSWIPVGAPIRIEAKGLEGPITVTATVPEEATKALPKGGRQIFVATSKDEGWVPIGTGQDTDGRPTTETTSTEVALVGANSEQILAAVRSPLWSSAKASDPLAAALFAGKAVDACVAGSGPILAGSSEQPYCNDFLESSNRYRLTLANHDAVPFVAALPDGISPPAPTKSEDPLLAYIAGDRGARKVLVPATRASAVVTYAGEGLPARSRVIVAPDVEAWTLYALRETLLTTVDRTAGAVRPASLARVDRVLAQIEVTGCTSKAGAVPDGATAALADETAKKAFATCLPVAVKALAAAYGKDLGARTEAIAKDLTSLLALGGDHASRVDQAWRALAQPSFGMPAHQAWTAEALRYMTKAEVDALPVSELQPYGKAHSCSPPARGDARVAGAPATVSCLWIVGADLDGDGAKDRLVTWAVRRGEDPTGTTWNRGASAYFSDGRISILPAGEVSPYGHGNYAPGWTVHLGNDKRQQALAWTDYGAHSETFDILTTTPGRSLHLVRQDGRPADMFVDGAVQMASGFGCYTRDGTGRLALWYWAGSVAAPSSHGKGQLVVQPMQLDGLELRAATPKLTYDTSGPLTRAFKVGSDCTVADPAQRGPYRITGIAAVPTTSPND